MNRSLVGILGLIILLQVGIITLHFTAGGGSDLRMNRLDHLNKYLLAMISSCISVANYNMSSMRQPDVAAEQQKLYEQSHQDALKELDALKYAYAGSPTDLELVTKARRLADIGDNTVRALVETNSDPRGDRQSHMLVLFAAMMKLNKVTNGLLDIARQLSADAETAGEERGGGGLLPLGAAAATLLAAIAGIAITLKSARA